MRHAIFCKLKDDSHAARSALRLAHLQYIQQHRACIVAGGPVLTEANEPWMMVLFTNFAEKGQAEDFIRQEPYTASGRVFESVEVRAWSQVLPEPEEGALRREIDSEHAKC